MKYSDYLKTLQPRADDKVAPVLDALESDGVFDSGEVRNITCPPGYHVETPAHGVIATGVINWSSVHDASLHYTWEVCPEAGNTSTTTTEASTTTPAPNPCAQPVPTSTDALSSTTPSPAPSPCVTQHAACSASNCSCTDNGVPQTMSPFNKSCGCRCEPTAYSYKPVIDNVTCTDTCLLSLSTLCVPSVCTWAASSFGITGVKTAPIDGHTVYIGQKMTVECQSGYQLAPKTSVNTGRRSLLGDYRQGITPTQNFTSVGIVKVLAFMSFPPPPPGQAVSYGMVGAFSDITLDLPAGAWPADLLVGPSMAIFEMPAGARRASAVAGPGLSLGPDGTTLALPATITTPVNSDLDLGNRELRVHRYNPADDSAEASWTPMPFPEGYQVPPAPTVVKATTSSFSGAYMALAVPPASWHEDIRQEVHPVKDLSEVVREGHFPIPAAGCASSRFALNMALAVMLSILSALLI
jgi:hypothetical protein